MNNEESFNKAIHKGDFVKIKAQLKDNPNLVFSKEENYDGDMPLQYAATKGYAEVVKLLLANEAEVDAKATRTHLINAARG